jgi:hypothetical protein
MMFLVVAIMMFVMATNSVKYKLHMNIIPQEGYKGMKNQCLWTGPQDRVRCPLPEFFVPGSS